MPKVSVIIPTYNSGKYLSEALESVLKQTYQDFEIILVDDGSTDNTKETVKKYKRDNPDKIRYFYQKNKGLAGARNTGLREARGSLIALLDADDIWFPKRLEETVCVIEADQSIGLVHADITRINENGAIMYTLKRNLKFLTGDIFDHIFLRKADISIGTVLFRTECYKRIGCFDENLNYLGCEDRELWLRISRHYKFKYIDKVLGLYRVRGDSMSRNIEKMMQARIYVIDKFCLLYKDCQKLRNKALAKIYRDLGDEFLIGGEFNKSREQYLRAIILNPISFWPWINCLKALLKIRVRRAQKSK